MNRWTKIFLILCLAQNTVGFADSISPVADISITPQSFDPNKIWQACQKDTAWNFCNDLGTAEKNTEKWGTHTLENLGLLNTVMMMGIAYKVSTDKKIVYKDKTNLWFLPGDSRQIEIAQNKVILLFSWPLPW